MGFRLGTFPKQLNLVAVKKKIYGPFFIILPVLANSLLAQEQAYFQQQVAYEIRVTLDDSAHTLRAHEIVMYSNNSPDTLSYIWFHLWPNAYRNEETAYARQAFKNGSTRFRFSSAEERGYIDSLDFRVGGKELQWEFHPDWIDVARVHLPNPLAPGEKVTIETPFYVKLPIVFSRLGRSGKHYEITQWYPKPAVYDRDGWHPMPYLNQGEFYSEFGSFDVYITLPRPYRVMATGDLVDGDAEYAWLDSLVAEGDSLHALDKKAFKKRIKTLKKAIKRQKKKQQSGEQADQKPALKTLHFHQEQVHDFAWFADPHWIVRKGELYLADSTRRITLWSMYLPKNAKLWENSVEYLHDSGYWYSRFYGDYPYNHITAVDGDLSAGGGMEYPNITVISSGGSKDLLEFVIMHEVGHNWFYGILGSNERDHAWLDEGLNEYTNTRYWEKKYGHRNSTMIVQDKIQTKLGVAKNLQLHWVEYMAYWLRSTSGDDQPVDLPSDDFTNANYGTIVYMKTALFTRYLQHYLGEEKIDTVMQDYYRTWQFKHPQPGDLRAVFKKHIAEDLNWYFEDAINATKVIDYSIDMQGNQVVLTNRGSMDPPLEVAFYDQAGNEIERRWWTGFSASRKVNTPAGTVSARIDPEHYLPDIDRSNNATARRLDLHFVFDQPDYSKREVYWLPWAGWNAYNGTTPGLSIYSGFMPTYRYGLSLVPLWDFEHGRLAGSIGAQRTFFQVHGFRQMTVSAGVRDFSGRSGAAVAFKGTIRKAIVSTPTVQVKGVVYTHNISKDAVDSTLYRSGRFALVESNLTYSHRPDPLLGYIFGVGLTLGVQGSEFLHGHISARLNWRATKKVSTRARLWVGQFLNAEDVPNQYRTYLGGGVDPNFTSSLVLNRTDDGGRSSVNVYDEQYIVDGPAMRGRAQDASGPLASKALTWGLNLDQKAPFIPLEVFLDLAGASDLEGSFLDGGLKFSLGFINIYLPLYQSWDANPTPTGVDWIKERLRFELRSPLTALGL